MTSSHLQSIRGDDIVIEVEGKHWQSQQGKLLRGDSENVYQERVHLNWA